MGRKAQKLPSGNWRVQVTESKTWDNDNQKWKYKRKSLTARSKSEAEALAYRWDEAHKPSGLLALLPDHFVFEPSTDIELTKEEIKEYAETCFSGLNGIKFEELCYSFLKRAGYICKLTKRKGDHGADIVAMKGSISYVFQCKYSKSNIGFDSVKEVFTAKSLYGADQAIVITNSNYTVQAILDASSLGVTLWNGDTFTKLLKSLQRKS